MKALVTGTAGFIGSTLTDRLLAAGHQVKGFDNFSTGRREFLSGALTNPAYELVEGDLLDSAAIERAAQGIDMVFHLAANADVRFGPDRPRRDMEQNTICTAHVLEAVRVNGIKRIAFSSTGSVYGEPEIFPTPEDAPFPVQTSLYGASKVAAEGMIAAYSEAFGIQSWIFRFVSILGERYTHGHVIDFYKQLLEHPESLRVLGNGKQRKSYLYVQDCVNAIFTAIEAPSAKVNIYNLGTDEYCMVNDSISWLSESLHVQPALDYTGGDRGWIGDNPFIFLDTKRIRNTGWAPQLTIRQAVEKTVGWLQQNHWVLD